MTKEQLKKEILTKRSLLKKGVTWLSDKYACDPKIVKDVLAGLKNEAKEYRTKIPTRITGKRVVERFYDKIKDSNPEMVEEYEEPVEQPLNRKVIKNANPDNVLFIGDLHAPFILDGYLEFNMDLQKKYDCGTVIFAGDLIDSHSWSFHEHNVDGMSVRDELKAAITQLKSWYKAFPNATSLFGNHDLLISRKASAYGLSQIFLKYFGDIIEAPKTWSFLHELYRDKVLYIHGSQGNAITRATSIRHSVAQGHLHSETFTQWSVSEIDSIFGLQVGCGLDRKAYAFEYAKDMVRKPVISSGVILNKGSLPIVELMKL